MTTDTRQPALHVVCVSYYYERFLTSPEVLLDRYRTLVHWADGLKAAGARVSVVQRFGSNRELERNGVRYRFVRDFAVRFGGMFDFAARVNAVVAEMKPDVVHANGLLFARQAARLKAQLPEVPILLQDHANAPPARRLGRWLLRDASRRMDAVSFLAEEQALPWREAGFFRQTALISLPEGTSVFKCQPRETARAKTGLHGHPLCLWVGRLNANKDPLTVLRGFEKALTQLPGALLVMAYGDAELLPEVRDWLNRHPRVAGRVALLGAKPHSEMEDLYNSADFFLLGSHREGSGYAVLEALSCGVAPLLTDIPSFRVLTDNGRIGGLWPVEDADALAATLLVANALLTPGTSQRIRDYFEANHSVTAMGQRALAAYTCLRNRGRS